MRFLPQKKVRLVVLLAFLALAAVFAEAFVFTALDHDCIGEYCPICPQIEMAQRLLDGLGRIGAIGLVAAFAAACASPAAKNPGLQRPASLTLVSLKIKYNS